MAREQIPINPDILIWAREKAGFTQDELYATFKKIKEWEEGESFPTYGQLERLSDKLKCPIAVFFFSDPPDLPPIRTSFRTLPDTEFDLLPSTVRLLLRKGKAMQMNLKELKLSSGKELFERRILEDLRFDPSDPISSIVDGVRTYLEVSLVEQMSWRSTEEALKKWRHVLAQNGVFVFKDPFKDDDYCGFCLYDDDSPIIYLNSSSSKTRQIFSIFHELAHLIFKTSGIDKQDDDYIDNLETTSKRIEVLANSFSAAFLVPDKTFDEIADKVHIEEIGINRLAKIFSVSREVILRKFLDRGLVTQYYYTEKVAEWKKQYLDSKKKKSSGGDTYSNWISYLGRDYINIALDQFYRRRISEDKLAEYLNIKPKFLQKFQDKYSARGS